MEGWGFWCEECDDEREVRVWVPFWKQGKPNSGNPPNQAEWWEWKDEENEFGIPTGGVSMNWVVFDLAI